MILHAGRTSRDLNPTTFSFPRDALTEETLFYGIIQKIKAQQAIKAHRSASPK